MDEKFFFKLVYFWLIIVKIYSSNQLNQIWSSVPSSSVSPGKEGDMAHDADFLYYYKNEVWHRHSIQVWLPSPNQVIP